MKFQDTKEWFIRTIKNILSLLELINTSIKESDNTNLTLKSFNEKACRLNFEDVIKNLNINLEMIKRNKMKCVVFGKTSNGKSAIINRIIGSNVLPSRFGRTTSCFISVEGCDENSGYLLDSNEKRQSINDVQMLANEFNENKVEINSLLKLFWPKSKCPLLKNDLEIFDSPGVDYSKENDKWINKYCHDADVFLLVIDGQSTLNESEKTLFIKIKDKLMKPNIFVLVNKWDLVSENSTEIELNQLRKQHSDTISKFLCQELNLYDPNYVSKQIYYVSATKDNAYFNEFVKHFCDEISKNAIEMKFRPHFDKVRNIITGINDFALDYFNTINRGNHMNDVQVWDFRESIINLVKEIFQKISSETKSLIEKNVPKIVFSLRNAVEKKLELDQLAINFLEVEFAKILSDCFKINLDNLENIIKMKFMENSSSQMSIEELQIYFTNNNDLEDLSNQYEECISLNVKNMATDIRNSFNAKEGRVTIYNSILKSLRVGSKVLIIPAYLLKKLVRPAALVLTGLSIAGEFIPESANDDIPKEILNALSESYQNLTNSFIDEFQNLVTQRIEQSIIDFVTHQTQIIDKLEEFESIQQQCIMILNDVLERDDDLISPVL